jgi:hypothetical protein
LCGLALGPATYPSSDILISAWTFPITSPFWM